MTPVTYEPVTALALTDQEWTDLDFIVSVWRLATEGNEDRTEEEIVTTIRRRMLADRITEAAHA